MTIVKAQKQQIDRYFLRKRTQEMANLGYPKPRWIDFCEEMLVEGFQVILTEHKRSTAKYIAVAHNGVAIVVRFASDIDITHRHYDETCFLRVGGNNSNSNTHQAMNLVIKTLKGENYDTSLSTDLANRVAPYTLSRKKPI